MIKVTRILLLLSFINILAIGANTPASAHLESDWYKHFWWAEERAGGVDWNFTTSTPPSGSNFRQRVKEASWEWNSLAGDMQFNFLEGEIDIPAFNYASGCPAFPETNGIHWGALAEPLDGDTVFCTYSDVGATADNRLHSFQIKFDSTEDWYTIDAGPVPSGKNDLESGAVHEFGHATGRGIGPKGDTPGPGEGHFDKDGSHCQPETEANHHTMCQFWVGDRIWDRSLNEHDRDAFDDRYL